MQRFAPTALLVALTATLGACATTGSSGGDQPADATPTLLEIQSHQHGQQSAMKFPTLKLISDQAGFDALGIDNTMAADFKSQDMIILGLGELPTGGYKVRITQLLQTGSEVVVMADVTAPGKDSMTTQALTSPYCIVTVDKLGDVTLASDVRTKAGK